MRTSVAVIGCGYWGPNFVRNFFKLEECEPVAVADLRQERLEQIKRRYPSLHTTRDPMELIRRPDIDAVAIVTPVSTHYQLAKEALLHGKHVLVTKPLTACAAEAEELIHLAEDHRRTLLVDHTFIYSGPVQTIRALIEKGELGEIYYYDSTRINLGLFQNDVNVIWDLGPHDFSIMLYLLGREPTAVSAIASQPASLNGNACIANLIARFSDGLIGHFHLSWLSPVKIRRTLLGGANRMIVYDHLDPDNQVKVYNKGVQVQTTGEKDKLLVQYRSGDMYAPKVDQSEALETECQHFLTCIREGSKPLTSGEDGYKVVRLLEAAQLSHLRGGEFVQL
jgi:predicted dehydrogenase